jgi:hypothetical protein
MLIIIKLFMILACNDDLHLFLAIFTKINLPYMRLYCYCYCYYYYYYYYYYCGSTALCWALGAFSVTWSYTQSVGLLGRRISPSQGLYLHSEQYNSLSHSWS